MINLQESDPVSASISYMIDVILDLGGLITVVLVVIFGVISLGKGLWRLMISETKGKEQPPKSLR